MSAEDIEYMGDYKEFPTKESALDWLDNYLSLDERNNLIKALQQEPILDKIRAEICKTSAFYHGTELSYGLDLAIKIVDKYKAENL